MHYINRRSLVAADVKVGQVLVTAPGGPAVVDKVVKFGASHVALFVAGSPAPVVKTTDAQVFVGTEA